MVFVLQSTVFLRLSSARVIRFNDPHPEGRVIVYWRLTNDPAIRDHANYHNTDCWSHDGRYVCYTHHGSPSPEIHVFDLHRETEYSLGRGMSPRWAKKHNWVLFSNRTRKGGTPSEKDTQVLRYDCESGRTQLVSWGMEFLGSTDAGDRWIYGNQRLRHLPGKEWRTVRARMLPESPLEVIYSAKRAIRPLCNPNHPVISLRVQEDGSAFGPRRIWIDQGGRGERIGIARIETGHAAWSGDGLYQLVGNYQARGRKWNEPFPSNLHLLANAHLSDISPCGRSGRWICDQTTVADLRSGDSIPLPRPPSGVCLPAGVGDMSDGYDADAKGSPDGTKICFVSNYDFGRAPFAQISEKYVGGDSMTVTNTRGFPEKGEIDIHGEVIEYSKKGLRSFAGLKRNKYDTQKHDSLKSGWYVTLFAERLMTADERERAPEPPSWLARAVGRDSAACLLWQRQTDVYVSVIRLPDPPHLRKGRGGVELIPGENHAEIHGYYLVCDGLPINRRPLRPGQTLGLSAPGVYEARAIEWSGLQGKPSLPLKLEGPVDLIALPEPPDDFSWTRRRWRCHGSEVGESTARAADEALCEVVHLHDGLIRRVFYKKGLIVAAEDYNLEGRATRKEKYLDGKLVEREYHTSSGLRVSLEKFDTSGMKVEETHWRYVNGEAKESDRWIYESGCPVKRVFRGGRATYEKNGEEWVRNER